MLWVRMSPSDGVGFASGIAISDLERWRSAIDEHGDLLRHKGFQVRWMKKTPASITKPVFADWCANELEQTTKIHHWLVEHLG